MTASGTGFEPSAHVLDVFDHFRFRAVEAERSKKGGSSTDKGFDGLLSANDSWQKSSSRRLSRYLNETQLQIREIHAMGVGRNTVDASAVYGAPRRVSPAACVHSRANSFNERSFRSETAQNCMPSLLQRVRL